MVPYLLYGALPIVRCPTHCLLRHPLSAALKAARDGDTDATPGEIPDGFYLVADSSNPQTAWHKAIIEA